MVAAVGKLSYNQLVEKIIDYKHSADSSRVSEGNTDMFELHLQNELKPQTLINIHTSVFRQHVCMNCSFLVPTHAVIF